MTSESDSLLAEVQSLRNQVAELTQQRDALQAQLALLRELIDAAPVSLYIKDPNGRYVFVNQHVAVMYEKTVASLEGQLDRDVFPPATIDGWRAHEHAVLAANEPQAQEVVVVHRDGDHTYLEIKFPLQLAGSSERAIGGFAVDITQQKQGERDLRANQELLRAVVDNSPAIIYVKDHAGHYQLVNRQFLQMPLVRDLDNVLGKTDRDFMPPEIATVILENDRAVVASGHPVQLDEDVPQDDGIHNYIAVKFPLYNNDGDYLGLCGISTDITERKQMEQQLQRSEERFRVLSETIPVACFIVQDGCYVYANSAAEYLTGYSHAEIETFDVLAFVHPDDHPIMNEYAARRLQGEDVSSRYEIRIRPRQGNDCWVDLNAYVVDFEGKRSLFIVMWDITERKQEEAERAHLQQQIIEAQQSALQELSIPLIPIADRVLVLPLIGTIDSRRAQQMLEILLEGVSRHQAHVVIVDITGVQMVDTRIAHVFIQTARAVQLLGAQVVLTGIHPTLAQTLAHLGIDLSLIETRATLQAGIEQTLQRARMANGRRG